MTFLDFLTSPLVADPFTQSLHIACGDCTMAGSSACGDCIVTFLCDGPASSRSVDLDADEAHTLALLRGAGLGPQLRHRPRPSAAHDSWRLRPVG